MNDKASLQHQTPSRLSLDTILRPLASPTRVAVLLGVACTGLVGASFYVQHVLGVEPCPLCIIQRFTYLALAVICLGAAVAPRDSSLQRGLIWFAALLTLGGFGVAGYQTHLQLAPPALTGSCSASLSYMLETLSVTDVLAQLLNAKGDCSDTSFKVLGLTLAQGSLLIFTSFALLLGTVLVRRRRDGLG
jgi:protein dithiol:quinone oxidoreductase